MFTHPIIIADTDLASRQAAAALRAQIEQHVLSGNKVSIDLSAVLSISESYADELFGVLALRYGFEWLTNNVAIRHPSPFVFRAIASAIRQRLLSQTPATPDIALLAARKALKQRQSRNT
ncbi:MAG: STAS-like domain-containing protein [Gallionella sp.]|nr:STAS-like domain-containing protein [Gallionella sp.]